METAALIQVHADIFFVHSAAARILKGIVRALRCHNNFSLHATLFQPFSYDLLTAE